MTAIRDYFRRMGSRQVVRPWALAAPVAVLLIALPLLRPLRAPLDASENELSRLAAIEALVERDGLAINDTRSFADLRQSEAKREKRMTLWTPGDAVRGTIIVGSKYYSDKPPVIAYLIHVTNARHPAKTGAWLIVCGLCASFAAVIDLSAAPFLALLVPVILAFGWNWGLRFGGVVLYTIGAAPALLMYASLTLPVTGDLRPGFLHPELVGMVHKAPSNVPDEVDDSIAPAAWKIALFRGLDRTMGALVGSKGVLSHFPVIVVGVLGLSLVLRRHWPASTKVMAAVTLIGAVGIMGGYIFLKVDWTQAMFGPRWFIVFLPLV